MSLLDRRHILALALVLPLAACGFSPVYAPGGTGDAVRNQIALASPEDRLDFELVSRLEHRIGRVGSAPYLLDYAVTTETTELGVSETEDIDRINIYGTVAFTVTESATGAEVQTGEVRTFTAYASSSSPVATTAARRDAEDRLMIALADQIVAQLLSGVGALR